MMACERQIYANCKNLFGRIDDSVKLVLFENR